MKITFKKNIHFWSDSKTCFCLPGFIEDFGFKNRKHPGLGGQTPLHIPHLDYHSEMRVKAYSGYYFNPGEYSSTILWREGAFIDWIYRNIYYLDLGVLGITLTIDLCTYLRIRSMVGKLFGETEDFHPEAKRTDLQKIKTISIEI